MQKISPFLWFDTQAEEAMNFYVSVFQNSRMVGVWHAGDKIMGATAILDGLEIQALNGGPQFKFTEAISLLVNCEDQAEVDELWAKLTVDGGTEGQCGWLKDKYGLSWQIIPKQLGVLLGDKDPVKAERVKQAMLKMKKMIIKDLQDAYDQA
ncbi:MAG: VOC family protein [Candidatus Kerfeldbacteria bacterium]|nr:VOC family protein [Candidatus Kerfeldbacteria bacterium]